MTVYLDHAATSPLRREALEAMWPYLTSVFGNPSSTHEPGREARLGMEHARSQMAVAMSCRPGEIVFTSGGTEADNLAIIGLSSARPKDRRIVTTAIEHEAVLEACSVLQQRDGFEVVFAPLDRNGIVDVSALSALLTPGTTLCTVMYANNEIGTVQPVADIAAACREVGVLFHCDAVQAAGALSLDAGLLGIDAMAISAHKFGGPKGVGALYLRSGVMPLPTNHGGGQERGLRSGTENVASIVGMAAALTSAEQQRLDSTPRLAVVRDRLIDAVLDRVSGATLTGDRHNRLPGHASFCVPGAFGESVLVELENEGVVASSGSACAAGSPDVSHVLTAIGIDEDLARTALRFTMAQSTLDEEVDRLIDVLPACVERVRSLG